MPTRKLYEQDVTLRRFSATVLQCTPAAHGYAVELDATAFFPEGGGQPCDLGTLGGAAVLDVQEQAGRILHDTDAPLAPGSTVEGEIDAARRSDLTCQHSGEHIVSGLIHSRFGFDNVGFHLGGDTVTIDFNGVLSPEQLAEIEAEANAYIRQNHPVEILLPSEKQLEQLTYRSKKEIQGQVRIVRFPGADTCACCGTHVRQTGEIGLVKLLSVQHFRSGCRIEMLSGERAFGWLSRMSEQNRLISGLLSAKPAETAAAVQRLLGECASLKEQLAALRSEQFAALAAQYAGKGDVLLFAPQPDAASVRRLCVAVMERCGGLCLVCSGSDDSGYQYAVGQAGGDVRAFVKRLNGALGGRGGGRDAFFAQGSLPACEAAIRAFWETRSQC